MQKIVTFDTRMSEAKIIIVTDEMKQAGAEIIYDMRNENDAGYLAAAIYLAMEYERLDN